MSTPSFTAWPCLLYGHLKASQFACCMNNSLSWKPVLFVTMWAHCQTRGNTVSLLVVYGGMNDEEE